MTGKGSKTVCIFDFHVLFLGGAARGDGIEVFWPCKEGNLLLPLFLCLLAAEFIPARFLDATVTVFGLVGVDIVRVMFFCATIFTFVV